MYIWMILQYKYTFSQNMLNFLCLYFSTFQICNEDCILNGVHSKKDLTIAIPINAIHRDPEYWEELETFTLIGNTCNTATTVLP